jgi:hypothetical protein
VSGHADTRGRAREQLRRAVEDGERIYRAWMSDEMTVGDGHRLMGLLTRELESALAALDALEAELDKVKAFARSLDALKFEVQRDMADPMEGA